MVDIPETRRGYATAVYTAFADAVRGSKKIPVAGCAEHVIITSQKKIVRPGVTTMSFHEHERPNKGKTDIWLTPPHIIEALGPFDLDPCGEIYHRTANTIYCSGGLNTEWFGRVWLNPPYSEVEVWLDKMIEHNNGVALVFARTDTRWAQKAMKSAYSIFFPRKRLTFLKPDLSKPIGNAGAPSMFLSFGYGPNWSRLGEGTVL